VRAVASSSLRILALGLAAALAAPRPGGVRAEEPAPPVTSTPPAPALHPLSPRRLLGEPDGDDRQFAPPRLRFRPAEVATLPAAPRERSWLVPLGEILAGDAIAWGTAYAAGKEWAKITPETVRSNLTGPWTFDPNGFATNQLGHPYQGHVYFAAARAGGFSFWQAAAFPAVASTLWELVAETERPSINDAITTPVGGTFLGEVLFRLSRMVLESGGLHPSPARQWASAVLSPPAAVAYALTGNRYRTRSEAPIPYAFEARLGGSFSGSSYRDGEYEGTAGLVSASLQVTHGLPSGTWRLREPFDHFDFHVAGLGQARPSMVLQARGLLEGWESGGGASRAFTGLWGVYETNTFEDFRASTSAVGFGTTGQWAASNGIALQGTALLAAGFGAAGSREGSEVVADYHYGAGGFALLEARILAADRGAIRLALRQFFVGARISPDAKGHEAVAYHTFGATLRVFGHHAVGLDVTRARRWAGFPDRPGVFEAFSQAIAYYAYVSDATMGSGLSAVASGN
jgi:hypothetical protein